MEEEAVFCNAAALGAVYKVVVSIMPERGMHDVKYLADDDDAVVGENLMM